MTHDDILSVLLILIPAVSTLGGSVITAAIKEKGAKERIEAASKKSAQETAQEIYRMHEQQHNNLQEDLANCRNHTQELYDRLVKADVRIDSTYMKLSRMRQYADLLRLQLVTSGIEPVEFALVENGANND